MNICRLLAMLFLPALLLAAPLLAQDDAEKKIEAVLLNPPATGLMAISIVAGSQAEEVGLRPGDVVVSYDGVAVTGLVELNAQKAASAAKETVEMVAIRRDRSRVVFTIRPGPIGVYLISVKKGVPGRTLPPATGVRFDFSALAGAPREDWYLFTLDGKTKVGFEHSILKLAAGKLMLRREVAFDGGEQWGINHFDVTVIATADEHPTAIATSFLTPLTERVGRGRLKREETGWRWMVKWPETGEEQRAGGEGVPRDLIPSYLVETLACFMPRETGTCYHFRPLAEGDGTTGLRSALVAIGPEEIEHGGKKVETVKYEQHRFGGGVTGTYWIGPDSRVLRVDYGGAQGTLTTKEAALKGLHPEIKPRTK